MVVGDAAEYKDEQCALIEYGAKKAFFKPANIHRLVL